MTTRERIAKNFIEKHGMEAFRSLLEMLQSNISGVEIGKKFGVSRERVRQWRDAFGNTLVYYQVHQDILSIK